MESNNKHSQEKEQFLSAYAPDTSSENGKFYEELQTEVDKIRTQNRIRIMGIINATIGNGLLNGVIQRRRKLLNKFSKNLNKKLLFTNKFIISSMKIKSQSQSDFFAVFNYTWRAVGTLRITLCLRELCIYIDRKCSLQYDMMPH